MAGKTQNTIVLNGKIYNAVTGNLIFQHPPQPPTTKPVIHKKTGLMIDGVIKRPVKKKFSPITTTEKSVVKSRPARQHSPMTTRPHAPRKANVLMRNAVHRPINNHETHHRHVTHEARHKERLERAKNINKSEHIKHFPAHRSRVASINRPLAVASEPKKNFTVVASDQLKASINQIKSKQPVSESERLITNALKTATAHEANQPFAKKPKRRYIRTSVAKGRTARITLATFTILLVVGYFALQNMANLSIRIASNRAGFSASLPAYKPSGFSQNKIVTYKPGKITISFSSNSDERNYSLTQQVSRWNSQALADNYLSAHNKQYQNYQERGKTVYIFDQSNATWVDGGVWYTIEGKSSLNSDQLLRIASSI